MYGNLEQLDDGRWQLRFIRTLEHPVDKVWRAITEPEHLPQWFRRRSRGTQLTLLDILDERGKRCAGRCSDCRRPRPRRVEPSVRERPAQCSPDAPAPITITS